MIIFQLEPHTDTHTHTHEYFLFLFSTPFLMSLLQYNYFPNEIKVCISKNKYHFHYFFLLRQKVYLTDGVNWQNKNGANSIDPCYFRWVCGITPPPSN